MACISHYKTPMHYNNCTTYFSVLLPFSHIVIRLDVTVSSNARTLISWSVPISSLIRGPTVGNLHWCWHDCLLLDATVPNSQLLLCGSGGFVMCRAGLHCVGGNQVFCSESSTWYGPSHLGCDHIFLFTTLTNVQSPGFTSSLPGCGYFGGEMLATITFIL